jgi:hypothetical protein
MSEKSGKKKTKKAPKRASHPSVLANLPATRPVRLGGTRNAGATAPKAVSASDGAAAPKAASTSTNAAGPKAAAKKAATQPKAAAGAKRSARQKAAAKPKAAPREAPTPIATATPPRPVPPAEEPRRPSGPPHGTEVVTTAVQAVGELAQIGATLGVQALKRAAGRLSRL